MTLHTRRAHEVCVLLESMTLPEVSHSEALWLLASTWNRSLLRYKARNYNDAVRWMQLPLVLFKLPVLSSEAERFLPAATRAYQQLAEKSSSSQNKQACTTTNTKYSL